ncbi:hypothetical protein FIV42_21580 [Persicimonas caeni]|uniref:Uncharacterized protein n=1 Tax=Persicimonas caeni TaxID=2292766 RepID=A0A4Y6PY43_PERCE|nr:hypothetical protein [Persicimonas caeni]QDG53242.1 hypothetical protein FIV42_21580 [Persicimonas caeni]QED34464.1 hypothetical protein FRD00_21575 [Persicimonas caeni]
MDSPPVEGGLVAGYDMKFRLSHLVAAAFLLSSTFAFSPQALAWNRDSHQRITELAYAYLKLYSICKDADLTEGKRELYNREFENCAGELRHSSSEGYTCESVQGYCEAKCRNRDSYETYLCVKDCVDANPEAEAAAQGEGCVEPYYYDPELAAEIESDVCAPVAYERTSVVWSDRCSVLGSTMKRLGITPEDAARTVSFYQNFQSTACPLADYPHKDEPGCAREDLNNPNEAQPLGQWDKAAYENQFIGRGFVNEPGPNRLYKPAVGELLSITNWVTTDSSDVAVDLTGSIIGFHTGALDKFADTYGLFFALPVLEEALKTGAEIAAGVGGGALALAAAVGGAIMCAVTCPITAFFGKCDDCFDKTWDTTKDILEETKDVIDSIEEENLFDVSDHKTEFFGGELTSMYHFMNASDDYDDRDGYGVPGALGPGLDLLFKNPLMNVFRFLVLDFKIDYSMSKRPLENYSVRNSDDQMRDSAHRGVFYWKRLGIQTYTFPPVDNLAYYWWHKWFEGRLNGRAEIELGVGEYGVMPLGAVLHGVQELTQPFHAWGITLQGHLPYEDSVSDNLDPVAASMRKVSNPKFFVNSADPDGEKRFLDRVGDYLFLIYWSGIGTCEIGTTEPCYKALRVRQLMHFLRAQTFGVDSEWDWSSDKPWTSWWDYELSREYTTNTAMPLAVASSIALLYEASQDPSRYGMVMDLQLSSFEHAGPVPGQPTPSSFTPVDFPDNYGAAAPSWECATATSRGADAVEKYFNNDMTGTELLQVAYAEKMRCEITAAGLPVPPDSELDANAKARVEILRSSLGWLEHGDNVRLEEELACTYADWPAEMAVGARNRYQERCDGLLDSDHDGVYDQNDECHTPESLLAKGYTAGSNGCVFTHEALSPPPVNPFSPGAMRRTKP